MIRNSPIEKLSYDGWGLKLPAPEYIQLTESKAFKTFVSDVESYVNKNTVINVETEDEEPEFEDAEFVPKEVVTHKTTIPKAKKPESNLE